MFNWLRRKTAPDALPAARADSGLFSTHADLDSPTARRNWRDSLAAIADGWARPKPKPGAQLVGMDASNVEDSLKGGFATTYGEVPEAQLMWYASQGFIGWQMCSLLMQHWLIEKACSMPAKDCVRKGYDITVNDGTKVTAEVLDYMKQQDKALSINHHMIEFLRMGRCFGIRIAKFEVESPDPQYYTKPFNIDGVAPWSYKGIVQIDPYWITPELSQSGATPGTMDFYKPEFWYISGTRIHRSHLIIYTTGQVPDVLKPSYYYAGVSVPQRIYERVYAAERTANEAPMLTMTKRLTVLSLDDITKAIADQSSFDQRMLWWTQTRDNYGVKVQGKDDVIQQFDLTLNDLDNVIMTQYQLVAAIAEVPGTKLLGTQPKGFNATGEFEESSYHEFLESLQRNDLAPLLERHHMLVIKSRVMPKFNIKYFQVEATWNELDAMTAQEQANVNLVNSQVDEVLIASGVIETADARKRLVNDPDSGYNGLTEQLPPPPVPAAAPADPNAPAPAAGVPSDPSDPKATLPDAKPPMPRVPAAPKEAGS